MATHPRSSLSEQPQFGVVRGGRKSPKQSSASTRERLISTGLALVVLGLMLWYLPTRAGNKGVPTTAKQARQMTAQTVPDDMQLSSVQMSQAVGGEALYLDGRVRNEGTSRVTAATVEVTFLDASGQALAKILQPLTGVPQGGVGAVPGEFANNPIAPNQTRFFRVAVEQVPPGWNHEVPDLKIVAVKAK